ncbi:putative disease resistance RPP13-like protein 1 [Helianthus annuus]|nr:putative disease resistance RPP13-like protein 1 [Helianthus annuus]
MNDLATSVANEFFVRLGSETRKGLLEKYRHMSFVREEYVFYHKFETLTRAKSLRTFLATSAGEVESWRSFFLSNKILVNLISELPLLRVLSLSYSQISEIPDSIGTLRHLRYLNLSRTGITHLPEKVCSLYNLHTLILFGCSELTELPNNFLKLKNLRHLDVRETRKLNEMPLGISELKSLQTLSKIIIGGKSGVEITKLKDFENLCGKVSIIGLEKVHSAIDARAANFSQKRLSEFEVVWSDLWDGSRNEVLEKDVLNELKPRNDKLIQLKIRSYGGLEFPTWVGDPLFLHLKHVSISGCRKCTSLPPLAQLPSLNCFL